MIDFLIIGAILSLIIFADVNLFKESNGKMMKIIIILYGILFVLIMIEHFYFVWKKKENEKKLDKNNLSEVINKYGYENDGLRLGYHLMIAFNSIPI